MNKQGIVEVVHGVVGGTKVQAEQVVDSILDAITKSLKKGDEVSIAGLGIFSVKARAARMARNPKTGEQVKELTARIELLERLCSQIEGERDNLREQNERLTRLLPITAGPAQAQEERKRSLWQRLFG